MFCISTSWVLSDCWLLYQRSTPFNQVEFVGDLIETDHGVGGKVYILDQDTLVIDEFSFDNDGFGVYINVATKGRNKKAWAKNRIDVPYPSGRSHNSPVCNLWQPDLFDAGTEGEPIEKLYKGDGQLIIDLKQVQTSRAIPLSCHCDSAMCEVKLKTDVHICVFASRKTRISI